MIDVTHDNSGDADGTQPQGADELEKMLAAAKPGGGTVTVRLDVSGPARLVYDGEYAF